MIGQLKAIFIFCSLFVVQVSASEPAQDIDYWTIEGMRSQQFSVGIFIFMIIGVLVFFGIIATVAMSKKKDERLKTGEIVMLVWIILGTIGAVIFGGMQLLQGRLF